MVFAIADHVIAVTDDGGNDAQIRLEARGKGHYRFLAQKCRQFALQREVHRQRAVHEPTARYARAEFPQRFHARFDDFRIFRQPQIVVRAQHDPALAFHDHFRRLSGFQRVKIGIDAHRAVVVRQRVVSAFFKYVGILSFFHGGTSILVVANWNSLHSIIRFLYGSVKRGGSQEMIVLFRKS